MRYSVNKYKAVIILLVSLAVTGCSTLSTLQNGELLYTGADIELTDKQGISKSGLKNNIQDLVRPRPNKKFLGLFPVSLWIYNAMGDSLPEKGLRPWLQTRLGEAPVIYKSPFMENNITDIENYLFNKGYFDADVSAGQIIDGRKVKIHYTIETNSRYTVNRFMFRDTAGPLAKHINLSLENSLIKPGDAYDLEKLKDERERIDRYLKNQGYYYFNPDYLIFKIDSSKQEKHLGLFLNIKDIIPPAASRKYRLGKMLIDADHSLENVSTKKDTLIVDDSLTYVYKKKTVKPEVINRSVMLRPGELYRHDNYTASLNKLTGLGIFKFVAIRFNETDTAGHSLETKILLSQSVPRSLRLVFQAVTKSTDFAGPGLNVNYRDRNFLGGAEQFNLSLNTAFETQIGGQKSGGNLYEVGLEGRLSFPVFIFPLVDFNRFLSKHYTPRTQFTGAYSFFYRSGYFNMNSADLSYGFKWQESTVKWHDLKLIDINYTNIYNTSSRFDSILSHNPLVAESFSEQFIFSLNYIYTFNNQANTGKKLNMYLQVKPEISGNVLSLANTIAGQGWPNPGSPNTFFGQRYAQYARLSADYRLYLKTNDNKLVTRLYAGMGIPYGNSNTLPYIKQFYTGGPNSLRAFRSRTVGPGNLTPDTLYGGYLEQTGEIKIEANLEYRFGIYRFLKGALFVDAGNIWLLDDPQKPDGVFSWSGFADQLALGTGLGLRIATNIVVLRFDLGTPLKDPSLPAGERWVIKKINPADPSWRKDKLVFNIAIGYPF